MVITQVSDLPKHRNQEVMGIASEKGILDQLYWRRCSRHVQGTAMVSELRNLVRCVLVETNCQSILSGKLQNNTPIMIPHDPSELHSWKSKVSTPEDRTGLFEKPFDAKTL